MHKKKTKMTIEGREYISKKIKKLEEEGYKPKQAVAIGYSMARKKGYKIPKYKK